MSQTEIRLPSPFLSFPFLIIEVTGERKKEKAAQVATVRNLWVPAVNNHGQFGRWAFLEIADPWDAKAAVRESLRTEEKR